MELAAGHEAKRQVGPSATRRRRRAHPRREGRSNTAKGDEQIPRTSPANARSAAGQAARTSPGAGPERALPEEHQARMTRTGGVSTGATGERRAERKVRSDSGDARQENRKGDATDGLGAISRNPTPKRDGPGGRQPPDGTARPVNVEGMRAKPQERRLSRSVRRREGDGRRIDGAGDQGPPPSRPALESGRPTGDGTG